MHGICCDSCPCNPLNPLNPLNPGNPVNPVRRGICSRGHGEAPAVYCPWARQISGAGPGFGSCAHGQDLGAREARGARARRCGTGLPVASGQYLFARETGCEDCRCRTGNPVQSRAIPCNPVQSRAVSCNPVFPGLPEPPAVPVTRSFTHSLIHSLTRSLARSLTH